MAGDRTVICSKIKRSIDKKGKGQKEMAEERFKTTLMGGFDKE